MFKGLKTFAALTVSSAMSNSSMGRKVILRYFGDDGERLILSLAQSLEVFYGSKDSKVYVQGLYSMIVQISILFDQNVINHESLSGAVDHIYSACTQVLYACALFSHIPQKEVALRVKDLSDQLNNVARALDVALEPHLKAATRELYKDVFRRLGDQKFINSLFLSSNQNDSRSNLENSLKSIMATSTLAIGVKSRRFEESHLKILKAKARVEELERTAPEEVNVWLFLKDMILNTYLMEFLDAKKELQVVRLLTNLEDYRETESKLGRKRAAERIMKNFFQDANEFPWIPAEIYVQLREQFDKGKDTLSSFRPTLFDPVLRACRSYLQEDLFERQFLLSEHFQKLKEALPSSQLSLQMQ